MTAVHHPIFARFLNRFSERAERAGQAEHRREALAGLSGRVIELGAGNGINFRHYPNTVTEVVAVEPEAYLRQRAEEAATKAPVPVSVTDGLGGQLPMADASFDAGVVSLVLCTIPDPDAALKDLFRVIRPGGELCFYEHVRGNTPRLQLMQDRLTRSGVWPFLAGGCHLNRDTGAAIERTGFLIENCRRFEFKPCFFCAPAAPHIIGTARRP